MIISMNEHERSRVYPRIMKSNVSGIVVLFYASGCGVTLMTPTNNENKHYVGENCIDFGMESFEDYYEPISIMYI